VKPKKSRSGFAGKFFLLILFIVLGTVLCSCSLKKKEQKIVYKEVWTQITDLPDRKIFGLALIKGQLWAATKKGLVKIDEKGGVSFPQDALPVWNPQEAALNLKVYNSILYVATLDGLVTFDSNENKWRQYNQAGSVRDIAVTPDNTIWVARNWGAARYNGSVWADINTKTSNIIGDDVNVTEIIGQTLMIGTNTGFSEVTGGMFKNTTGYHKVARGSMIIKERGSSELVNNRVLCFAGSETDLWIGTSLGLSNRKGSVWQTYTADHMEPGRSGKYEPVSGNSPLAGNSIRALALDENKNLYIGTSKGLTVFSADNKWKSYTMEQGFLPGREITCIIAATDTLWIGTNSGLACRKMVILI
jgi:ligand-binding sensor domain-containing protein